MWRVNNKGQQSTIELEVLLPVSGLQDPEIHESGQETIRPAFLNCFRAPMTPTKLGAPKSWFTLSAPFVLEHQHNIIAARIVTNTTTTIPQNV